MLNYITQYDLQELETSLSVGETKVVSVEGQGEIVLKQTSPGRGADLVDQQLIQLRAGLLAKKVNATYITDRNLKGFFCGHDM